MAGTNYNAKLSANVKAVFTNDDGFIIRAECNGNPNVLATQSNMFTPGCLMLRSDFNMGENLYQNTGTLTSPTWTAISNSSAWSSVTGTPTEVAYFDLAGNGTSDDEFVRDPVTHEGIMGFQTYATGTITDGYNQYVDWRADNQGTIGNSITLLFDGTDDTNTVLAAWNAANPSNTASVVAGTGNFTPTAATVEFEGGGYSGYTNTHTLLTQPIQFSGSQWTDTALKSRINGLLNGGNGVPVPFMGAFDFATSDQSILQVFTDQIQAQSNNGVTGDQAILKLDPYNRVRLLFDPGDASGESGIDAFYHTLRLRNMGEFWDWPTADGTLGQALVTDGSGHLSFGTPTGASALTSKYIGFGDTSNLLNGVGWFQYDSQYYSFTQTNPDNGSLIAWGSPSWTGLAPGDVIFDTTSYKSNRYGGHLIITVSSPTQFDWSFSGSYGQTIGSGSGVMIMTTPQQLLDSNGSEIMSISWATVGPYTPGDNVQIDTSLSTEPYGYRIYDTSNNESINFGVVGGNFLIGNDSTSASALRGNGTNIKVKDGNGVVELNTPNGTQWKVTGSTRVIQGTAVRYDFLDDTGLNMYMTVSGSETAFTGANSIITKSVDIPITVKTTLTPTDVNGMFTTPIAPIMTVPAGYAVQILDVYGAITYNTTPYATNTTINIAFNTTPTQSVWQQNNLLTDTSSVIRRFTKTSGAAAEIIEPSAYLVITNTSGDPTAGDSNIDVYITYKLILL